VPEEEIVIDDSLDPKYINNEQLSIEKKEPILKKEEDFADDKKNEVDVAPKYSIDPTADIDIKIKMVLEENDINKEKKPNEKNMKKIYSFLSKRKEKKNKIEG